MPWQFCRRFVPRLPHHFEYETTDVVEHFFYLRLSVEQGSCDGIWEMRKLQKRGPTDAFRLERDWVAFSRSFGCGPPATSLLQRPAHPDASKE